MALQTIICAFDFSEPASSALRWAHALADALHARLELVHVHPDIYDGRGEAALGLPVPSAGQEERYLRFLEQEVLQAARTVTAQPELNVRVHILRGDPVKRLLACADEQRADMVVVGATGKGRVQRVMLGSVSESLLRSSKVPVTIVH
ncbi:MAG TPA: universal stress protein [Polyangiales bacterium]|nr:universal stress protein [Polyangiales bacterium]